MFKLKTSKIMAISFLLSMVIIVNSSAAFAMEPGIEIGKDISIINGEDFSIVSYDYSTGETSTTNFSSMINNTKLQSFSKNGVIEYPAIMPEEMFAGGSGGGDCSIDTIFGNDDRREVNPYIWGVVYVIAYWTNGRYEVKKSTAFVIGNYALMTAAHCVFEPAWGGWCSYAYVTPYRSYDNPLMSSEISRYIHVSSNYINGDHSPDWDFAVIEIGSNIGQRTGLFGWTTASSVGNSITINGYPGDKRNVYGNRQWYDTGTITSMTTNQIRTNNTDAMGGQSGSPIYNSSYQALAVFAGENANRNSGARITSSVATWLATFR